MKVLKNRGRHFVLPFIWATSVIATARKTNENNPTAQIETWRKKGTLLRISMALCLTPKKPIDRGQINVETFPRYRVQTVEEKRISSKKPFRRFWQETKSSLGSCEQHVCSRISNHISSFFLLAKGVVGSKMLLASPPSALMTVDRQASNARTHPTKTRYLYYTTIT